MIELAVMGFDILAMPSLLDRVAWFSGGGHKPFVGVILIGTPDVPRPRHSDGVVVNRAPLGSGQVIIVTAFEDMRGLGQAAVGAVVDVLDQAKQTLFRRPFLQQDPIWGCRQCRAPGSSSAYS